MCVCCFHPTLILTSPFPLPGLLAAPAVFNGSWSQGMLSSRTTCRHLLKCYVCILQNQALMPLFSLGRVHTVLFIVSSIAVGLCLTNKGILISSISHLSYPKRKNWCTVFTTAYVELSKLSVTRVNFHFEQTLMKTSFFT